MRCVRSTSWIVLAASMAWACCAAMPVVMAAPAHRQVLYDTQVDARANDVRFPATAVSLTNRVLIAGDSWARYMWTDGSHNDIFDRYGFGDRRALSEPLSENPEPAYDGPAFAVDGSEAREWVDSSNFSYLANAVAALQSNPDIDVVLLSIGGNDMLAGRPDGGWYQNMDTDVAGSEAALLDQVRADTQTIIDAFLNVRPDIQVILSGYDFPNFNVGFWCFLAACPMREDLSYDPNVSLVSDEELNAMLGVFEGMRIDLANNNPRIHFDHSLGLMQYFFGDGQSSPETLPYPGQTPPTYAPTPGGNPLRPTLRSLFRRPAGLDADPIHLDYTGYQYKITNQMQNWFMPRYRADVTDTFVSEGGDRDGWTDGTVVHTDAIALGDNGATRTHGIVSFDTSSIPDGAVISRASLFLHRSALTGVNPFSSGNLGIASVDVMHGTFGSPAVEAGDAVAAATAVAVGTAIGSAASEGAVIRIDLDAAGLLAINDAGTTQFRIAFAMVGEGAGADHVYFHGGSASLPAAGTPPTLADHLGSAAPFLDVVHDEATHVAPTPLSRLRLRSYPNPFNPMTTLSFVMPGERPVPVSLTVLDVRGHRARVLLQNVVVEPGAQTFVWDGRHQQGHALPSGVYHVRLRTPDGVATIKTVLLK